MPRYVLAVDIGGTNLRIAVVDENGNVAARRKQATPELGDPRALRDIISSVSRELGGRLDERVVDMGVAAPVIMSRHTGRVSKAPNLPALDGVDLAGEIAGATGLRVMLENDATAAAVGEAWTGASRGLQNSICVTLGTGVGGGLIINGQAYRGSGGTAGEIGHICVEPEGRSCGCGSRGCLEQYSSALGVIRTYTELTAVTRTGLDDPTARDVYQAALQGEAAAIETYRLAGHYLGIAFAGLINVLDPEMIVIGGGLAAGWDAFMPETLDQVAKRAFREPAVRVKLVRAELGDDAGLLGVARIAFASSVQG